MATQDKLKFMVINGYPAPNRKVLDESGVAQADDLFKDFFKWYTPNAQIDTLYIADLDVPLPTREQIKSYDGIAWTGSNLTIYHADDPRVTRQIDFCRTVYDVGTPQMGTCWGVQMAATAAGGTVEKNPLGREWSIARDIQLTEAGKKHPLYRGKPTQFDGFIMHLDIVTKIPQGGTLLSSNAHSHVQSLEVKCGKGTFWATQYHPEFNLHAMARLLIARKEPLTKEGFFKSEDEVETLAKKMIDLSQNPQSQELRQALKIGDDVLAREVRQQEFRNWVDYLVLPSMTK